MTDIIANEPSKEVLPQVQILEELFSRLEDLDLSDKE